MIMNRSCSREGGDAIAESGLDIGYVVVGEVCCTSFHAKRFSASQVLIGVSHGVNRMMVGMAALKSEMGYGPGGMMHGVS